MLDYMQALRERFVGECNRERCQELHALRKEISQGISKENCRKLLRLVYLEAALREDYALENFLAGFKLAWDCTRSWGNPMTTGRSWNSSPQSGFEWNGR